MSNHITINGQTFASVEEMPPDVRRQYESAMQLLARNAAAAGDGSDADVNISTDNSDPTHRSFKTVTRMTSSRIIVNGKEYHHLEDVPAQIRAAFRDAALTEARGQQDATLSPASALPSPRSPNPTQISRTPAGGSLQDTTFDSSSSVTLRRITLLVLLLLTFLAGALIGALADAFIAGKFLH
ncbi:MAG TPA: hypothetical protein VN541_20415 [Tepidisphaeraceae bacterium]|nr:hypothetical protein [Tepidisphaeraceae bacterium]